MSARDLFPVLDEATHTYTVGGVVVPGVTSLLKPLCDWEKVPANVLDRAGDLGRAVHLATEYDDRGTLDADSVSEEITGYLAGWRRFRAEMNPVLIHRERLVYHREFGYAGTEDVEMTLNGELAIGDIKSGTKHRAHGVQLAGYALARKQEEGWATYPKRFGIYLDGDGRYELVPYNRSTDYSMFLSMLNINSWRAQP